MPRLSAAQYGKDNIRVYKVHKDPKTGVHDVVEMTVCVLLRGDIETSYTKADNSVVVATDSMKQTVYVLAKQHAVTPPELFAATVSSHFVEKYKHIHSANVKVKVHRWTRLSVDGKPHPHSFFRDGAETRNVEVTATETEGISIRSTVAGLLVLKSTGSAFHGFVRDEYTQLPEVTDRILSTEVDCGWQWNTFRSLKDVESAVPQFDKTWDNARTITLKTFALEDSPSVQNTMYKMCEQILAGEANVKSVDYSLPNKHYFEIDLSWHKDLKNLGEDAEVYAPQSDPNGLIQCTVSR